jgi:hypothetical protein
LTRRERPALQPLNLLSSVLFFLNRTRIIEHVAMVRLATI